VDVDVGFGDVDADVGVLDVEFLFVNFTITVVAGVAPQIKFRQFKSEFRFLFGADIDIDVDLGHIDVDCGFGQLNIDVQFGGFVLSCHIDADGGQIDVDGWQVDIDAVDVDVDFAFGHFLALAEFRHGEAHLCRFFGVQRRHRRHLDVQRRPARFDIDAGVAFFLAAETRQFESGFDRR